MHQSVSQTADALPEIIARLKQQGYTFGTVTEVLDSYLKRILCNLHSIHINLLPCPLALSTFFNLVLYHGFYCILAWAQDTFLGQN